MPVDNGWGRESKITDTGSTATFSACARMLGERKRAEQRSLEMVSNTEAVPGAPGFLVDTLG